VIVLDTNVVSELTRPAPSSDAARAYGVIADARRAAGTPISQSDAQVAAIARSRGAAVATRDIGGFSGCGIEVINPWRA
jgi:hypothetical protein